MNFNITQLKKVIPKHLRHDLLKLLSPLLIIFAMVIGSLAHAAPVPSHIKSRTELRYGVILYDYFQQDYFEALIQQSYAEAKRNKIALSGEGKVFKGGMMLSYAMSDDAKAIFNTLLSAKTTELVRNRAWYFLAKLYYSQTDMASAYQALSRIKGVIPPDILFDYHYLSTLLLNEAAKRGAYNFKIEKVEKILPYYPYLAFNLAIAHVKAGNKAKAVENLQSVASFAGQSEELSVLADRAKHGMAQIALKSKDLPTAWVHLQTIRTTGLYSNRALLSYAWAAINMKQYNSAVPALQILDKRSIAIPEVQECKVLLAHLYEQEGSTRRALKAYILAEKEFKKGIAMVGQARKVIAKQSVPREFIENLDVIMDESDWYGEQPSVDYKKLTPFLIDLMSSNAFHESLKELADLYAIEENLLSWVDQHQQHFLILNNAKNRRFSSRTRAAISRSQKLKSVIKDQSSELKLMSLTLSQKDQQRLKALLQTTQAEVDKLDSTIERLKFLEAPYQQPPSYRSALIAKHKQVKALLAKTRSYMSHLEKVVRKLVNEELNKHEERMRYYAAQSKLAKARLYDTTLMKLDEAEAEVKGQKK